VLAFAVVPELKNAYLIVCIYFFSKALFPKPLSQKEESNLVSAQWKLPEEFTEKRIEQLLNQFSEATFGKAFQYVGVEEDFFHGHVLFERKLFEGKALLHPRAILYHTQEEAHKAHWEKSIDPKYDYLNVTTRNWIQWLNDEPELDGEKIENARIYLDCKQKDPAPFFEETAPPQKDHHYTIHAKNLDSQKLGFQLAGELQFEFYSHQESLGYLEQKKVTVELPNESVELQVFTNTMFIERISP